LINVRNLTFRYPGAESAVINRASFTLNAGEIALVTGPTGSGKSTLLKMLNGLAPHFTSGTLGGHLEIHGTTMIGAKPYDFAHLVGYANQQPEGWFVASLVEDELAFGLEQLGIQPAEMKAKIADIAEVVGISDLLTRQVSTLSGGEQQKVAIAAALICGQKILLLDEPTSALDEASALNTMDLISDLAKNQDVTVVIAEHRYEHLAGLADSHISVERDGNVSHRQLNASTRSQLRVAGELSLPQKSSREAKGSASQRFERHGITVSFGSKKPVNDASLVLEANQINAIVGPNGIGKSSLLWSLHDNQAVDANIALVPQVATDLLILGSLGAELVASDQSAKALPGSTARIFRSLAGRIDPSIHPRDLSSGQQVALALALQLTRQTDVILLDEPTRGLDVLAKQRLAEQLCDLRDQGKVILLASHDKTFVQQVADRILTIESGQIVEVSP
jgi:energy-coupling factor transport system ATP-binding protein